MHAVLRSTLTLAFLVAGSSLKAGEEPVVGIWKSAVPPVPMKGEFANHDPIGLAAGAWIRVDCSINWTNPDTGKLYCFNSPTSFNSFLEWPKANVHRATEAFERGATQ